MPYLPATIHRYTIYLPRQPPSFMLPCLLVNVSKHYTPFAQPRVGHSLSLRALFGVTDDIAADFLGKCIFCLLLLPLYVP